MATDRREDILDRLMKVAKRIPGVDAVTRMNPDTVNSEDGVAIDLMDGPERRTLEDRRPGRASTTFTMQPSFMVFLAASSADAGKQLNRLRAAAIKAVVFDDELATLVGPNGHVAYLGCETSAERGRDIEGNMALMFELTYVLNPNLL